MLLVYDSSLSSGLPSYVPHWEPFPFDAISSFRIMIAGSPPVCAMGPSGCEAFPFRYTHAQCISWKISHYSIIFCHGREFDHYDESTIAQLTQQRAGRSLLFSTVQNEHSSFGSPEILICYPSDSFLLMLSDEPKEGLRKNSFMVIYFQLEWLWVVERGVSLWRWVHTHSITDWPEYPSVVGSRSALWDVLSWSQPKW